MKSQCQFVLDHLIDHGYITDTVAHTYRIRRLASRIHDLVNEGIDVGKETKRDALGQKYTYYYLTPSARLDERSLRTRGLKWNMKDAVAA